jgi:type IV pilus assembly protein PilX
MTLPLPRSRPSAQRQQGTVLLVALMFLIVLTLLGLSAMNATTLEEKMAGSSRDYNVALQAAEAALRDAEADLKGTGVVVGRLLTVSQFPIGLIGSGTPSGCNTAGLCIIVTETTQLYKNAAVVDWGTASTSTTRYGTWTGATAITGVAQAPRYVMELMQFADGKNKEHVTGSSADFYYIRITARGWGGNSQTLVTLQEVFIISLPT